MTLAIVWPHMNTCKPEHGHAQAQKTPLDMNMALHKPERGHVSLMTPFCFSTLSGATRSKLKAVHEACLGELHIIACIGLRFRTE